MMIRLPKGFDRSNAVVAGLVWLVILVVYNLTKAPTLSFWDCGEFIACSYILGIPHPPGTPAYLLIGRLFSMIPFTEDIAARINFLSAFCSAVAALFGYLTAVRVLRKIVAVSESWYPRVLIYCGAACGAFLLAFGLTQWGNSVEAEVYGTSMMVLMAMLWLTVIYLEHQETAFGTRLMLLVVYLGFFGIGVHMTTFLALPVCAIAFVMKKSTPGSTWFLLAAYFVGELFLIFALSSRPDELPFWLPAVFTLAFYVFYVLSYDRIPRHMLIAGAGLILASLPALRFAFPQIPQFLDFVSIAALLGLVGFGGYGLWQRLGSHEGHSMESLQRTTASVFCLTAAVAGGVVASNIRGYGPFLLLSVLLLAGIGLLVWRQIRWPVLIALAGSSLIVVGVYEFLWGSLVALVMIALLGVVWRVSGWRSAVLILLMATMGFSVHALLPIRSSLQPAINENNPSQSLTATINFIERKQYGSTGMIERMFERRGEWFNQFGNYRRMGFWGFFQEQFGLSGLRFLVLLVIGAFGLWETCRRYPPQGILVLILLLLCTVGLVLYMNFADGTREAAGSMDYLEVRDRDYFFTPGFMLFGLAIGIGLAAFVQYLRDLTGRFSSLPRRIILASSLVLFLVPVYTVRANYFQCDNSRNYVPYDYAYNILMSADPNAVLFTAGDNDTFPVWCLQEVYKVRPDVKNVNLSLANLDWYIKQARDVKGLRLGVTDGQIDSLRGFRTRDGRTFRIQDQVIDLIVRGNWGRVPINFSYTVPPGSRKLTGMQVDTMLEMVGMAYRLTDTATGFRIDTDRSVELATQVWQYRGWNDPTVHKTITALQQTGNIASCLVQIAEALVREGKVPEAEELLLFTATKIEYAQHAVDVLSNLYIHRGATEELAHLGEIRSDLDRGEILAKVGRAYRSVGESEKAESLLVAVLDQFPHNRHALDELMALYIAEQDVPNMLQRLHAWIAENPEDTVIAAALEDLERQIREAGSPGGDDSL